MMKGASFSSRTLALQGGVLVCSHGFQFVLVLPILHLSSLLPALPFTRFFLTLTLLMVKVRILFLFGVRRYRVYYRIFSTIPGFYPLDATSILPGVTIKMSPDISRCPLWEEGENSPVENYCRRLLTILSYNEKSMSEIQGVLFSVLSSDCFWSSLL